MLPKNVSVLLQKHQEILLVSCLFAADSALVLLPLLLPCKQRYCTNDLISISNSITLLLQHRFYITFPWLILFPVAYVTFLPHRALDSAHLYDII